MLLGAGPAGYYVAPDDSRLVGAEGPALPQDGRMPFPVDGDEAPAAAIAASPRVAVDPPVVEDLHGIEGAEAVRYRRVERHEVVPELRRLAGRGLSCQAEGEAADADDRQLGQVAHASRLRFLACGGAGIGPCTVSSATDVRRCGGQ